MLIGSVYVRDSIFRSTAFGNAVRFRDVELYRDFVEFSVAFLLGFLCGFWSHCVHW